MKVKRTEDDELVTDGGGRYAQSEITQVTRRQQAAEFFQEGVVTPFKIAWEDWRTKTALILIAMFVFTGLLVWLHQIEVYLLNWVLERLGSPWAFEVPRVPTPLEADRIGIRPFQNWEYPLGTFDNGVDILSALLYATPGMLQMILAGGVFSTVMATVVGTTAGYKGGQVETVLNTITDIAMAIPGLPLVVVIMAIFEPSSDYVIGVVITINVWAGLARTIHSQVLSLREASYVEASRTMGIGTPKIIRKDILPNLMPYIMVNFVYAARRVVYDSVALYYLGLLGGRAADNWGVMLDWAYNSNSALTVPGKEYMILAPMVPIVVISLALILLSQGTDKLFNPRVRTRHEGETQGEDDSGTEGDAAVV